MVMSGRNRLGGIWAAVFAVLLHVLMPVLPALAASIDEPATFPPVCIAHAEAPADSAPTPDSQPFQDCTLCIVHCTLAAGLLGVAGHDVILPARNAQPLAVGAATLVTGSACPTPGFPRGPPLV